MADYIGHIILAIFGMGITVAALMETLPRQLGPAILGWIGQLIIGLSFAHALYDLGEKVR